MDKSEYDNIMAYTDKVERVASAIAGKAEKIAEVTLSLIFEAEAAVSEAAERMRVAADKAHGSAVWSDATDKVDNTTDKTTPKADFKLNGATSEDLERAVREVITKMNKYSELFRRPGTDKEQY